MRRPRFGRSSYGMQTLRPSCVPLPTVERALDDLADDLAAEPEVGAEVFAVGVHHGHLAGLGPPGDQLLVEVLHRWTSPTATSSDHATWNHPVGFIDSGGFAIDRQESRQKVLD